MRKRFVAKKRRKKWKLRYLFYVVLIYFVYQFMFGYVLSLKIAHNNEDFLKAMLRDSNHHLLYERNSETLFTKVTNFLTQIDITKPLTIIEKGFFYEEKKTEQVAKTSADGDQEKMPETKYVSDPNPTQVAMTPRVYIYNTHQLENYSMANLEVYNITPNVMMTSYLLREKLNHQGISTIVEEANFKEYMQANPWVGKDQYKVSRQFLTQTLKAYPNMDLMIDLHRDAIKKTASTWSDGTKNYAKVLFVVGTAYDGYEKNLELANLFHQKINAKYPGLSRGVMQKEGTGVNGIYNQDVSSNMLLIECGGYENTIDEVANTTDILAAIITEYLGEAHEV